MRLIHRFKLSLFLVLLCSQAILMAPNRADAFFAACSWYNVGGTPWVFSYFEYNSWDVGTNNAIEVYTVQTSPFSASALDYWSLSTGGGYAGHEAPASIGPVYSFMGEGTLGFLMEGSFFPSWGASCVGNYQFVPPTASVILSPPVATVGDPVTATWGSSNAEACYFDNAPIALSGSIAFTAAMVDSRPYTLECENQWGWGSDTAILVVNEPAPDCPAEPIGVDGMTYLLQEGTTPDPENIGDFRSTGNPSITSEAYCLGNEWRLKIAGAQHTVRIDVNLANLGNTQITTGMINSANCASLETMRTSLTTKAASVVATFGGWYDEGAVKAHEHVHRNHYEAAANGLFNTAKMDIEAISIPLSSAANQAAAHSLLTSSSTPYTGILLNLNADTNMAYNMLNHSSAGEFIAAQQAAVSHFVTQINSRLSTCP